MKSAHRLSLPYLPCLPSAMRLWSCTHHTWIAQLLCPVVRCFLKYQNGTKRIRKLWFAMKLWNCTHHTRTTQLLCSVIRCYKGVSLVKKYTPMEVIFNSDLLVMKIKITYLILSPLVICYFRLILIFDLDQFLGDLPYLCCSWRFFGIGYWI